jgi:DTW domain-containing protein
VNERQPCQRCWRPPPVCFCRHIRLLPTRTRVVLLQHPKERKVGVGTARMAHLALPNSVLRVGLDFSADPVVREAVSAAEPVCVLFPRPGALDVSELPRDRPVTLVVLDGTWALARKLLRLNPMLARLPAVAFTPRRPSEYQIRRQPAAACVSTIEALSEVLAAIEPAGGPFDGARLLAPFRAMVARQRRFVTEVGAHRHRHPPRPAARPTRAATLSARLAAAWPNLVCVEGEANAWPRRDAGRPPPEIVHWVAHRPATGQTFEVVVAPRRPLSPAAPAQIDLPVARLAGGMTIEAWHAAWAAFLRDGDQLVMWGSFARDLGARDGLDLSAAQVDLRRDVVGLLRVPRRRGETVLTPRARVGAVDTAAAVLGVSPRDLGVAGRGGRRLAALVGIVRSFADAGASRG